MRVAGDLFTFVAPLAIGLTLPVISSPRAHLTYGSISRTGPGPALAPSTAAGTLGGNRKRWRRSTGIPGFQAA